MRNQLLAIGFAILMGCGGGGGLPSVQTDLAKELPPQKDAIEEVAPEAFEVLEDVVWQRAVGGGEATVL